MKINDEVYGKEEIKEQVLIELINSKEVQRLKEIAQWGMPSSLYHKNSFSRYSHSIGVLVLLRKLNADLNEQIAGLLHDISHTAFSHVVDWVLGDPTKEDYQDNIHLEMIKNSEIPKILEKYEIDYTKISNIENFSLLEKEAPCLCADRVDYTLRELKREIPFEIIEKMFFNLMVKDSRLVFKDKEIAEIFGREYIRLQNEHWAGNEARARYYILSKILKEAIQKKIISLNDLTKTDAYVINLLIKSKDKGILKQLNLLKKGFCIKENNDGIRLKKKFRYVDPEVFIENTIKPLSKLSFEYNSLLEKEKQNSENYSKILIF